MPPKKDDKKDKKPEGWNLDPIEAGIALLFLLALVGSIGPAIGNYFSSGEISFYGIKLDPIIEFFRSNSWLFKMFGFFVAGGAALGTVILNKKGDTIWAEERSKLYPENVLEQSASNSEGIITPDPTKEKWKKILEYSESESSSEWRIAIIEADIMLDDLLFVLNLPGDTIGDKLKAVEPSDFLTLNQAWEAHKARNMIAHQGSNFLLNQHETRRIISLYGEVFKEFGMI